MAAVRGRPRKQPLAAPDPNHNPNENESSNARDAVAVGNLIAQLQTPDGQPRGTANLTLQDLGAFEQPHDPDDGAHTAEEQPTVEAEHYDEGDVIQVQQQQTPHAKSSKKRRLDDRQEDAVRVPWDESQPSNAVEQPEPSQDEGFQTAVTAAQEMNQRRNQAGKMQRRQYAPQRAHQQAPEAPMSASNNMFDHNPDEAYTASATPNKAYNARDALDEEGDVSSLAQASNADTDAVNTPSQQPRKRQKKKTGRKSKAQKEAEASGPLLPLPDESPSQGYIAVNRQARAQSVFQQQSGQKLPQKRTPWSPEEIDRLMLLIERHGTSWALIKQQDIKLNEPHGLMVTRDQYALKDKARNMKCDYISSGIPLPPNFEYVALSRKEVDRIQSRRPGWMP